MPDLHFYLDHNPLAVLYATQAITYAVAAALSYRARHKDLCSCYLVSAIIHVAFALLHLVASEETHTCLP